MLTYMADEPKRKFCVKCGAACDGAHYVNHADVIVCVACMMEYAAVWLDKYPAVIKWDDAGEGLLSAMSGNVELTWRYIKAPCGLHHTDACNLGCADF